MIRLIVIAAIVVAVVVGLFAVKGMVGSKEKLAIRQSRVDSKNRKRDLKAERKTCKSECKGMHGKKKSRCRTECLNQYQKQAA